MKFTYHLPLSLCPDEILGERSKLPKFISGLESHILSDWAPVRLNVWVECHSQLSSRYGDFHKLCLSHAAHRPVYSDVMKLSVANICNDIHTPKENQFLWKALLFHISAWCRVGICGRRMAPSAHGGWKASSGLRKEWFKTFQKMN